MKSSLLPTLAVLFALSACRSVQWVPQPDLSTPLEDPAKARIRVARPGTGFLSGVDRIVVEPAQEIGILTNDGLLIWERESGPAVLGLGRRAYDQLSASWQRTRPVDLELELEAGRVYTFQVKAMREDTAKARREEAGSALVAWSEGFEAWELRLLDEEAGEAAVRATDLARVVDRGPEPERELYEGPGLTVPVPPVGEHVAEARDGSGVAFSNRFGHTYFLEWIPWPDGTPLPGTNAELETLATTQLAGAPGYELLHSEHVVDAENDQPQVFCVTRIAGGSAMSKSEGGRAERLDATRGMLVFPRGRTLYVLSWQWGPLPELDESDPEEWSRSRDRLLEFRETIRFSE